MEKKGNILKVNGISYIGIPNPSHVNCWFLVTVHLLHSSKILTILLFANDNIVDNILKNGIDKNKVDEIFNKLDYNNVNKIQRTILNKYPELFRTLIEYAKINNKDNAYNGSTVKINTTFKNDTINITKSGYTWISFINSFYLPILYYDVCANNKKLLFDILVELCLEPQLLTHPIENNLKAIIDTNANGIININGTIHINGGEIINNNTPMVTSVDNIEKLKNTINNYSNMLENLRNEYNEYFHNSNFKYRIIIVELYKDSSNCGHVIAIVTDNNYENFYVLDKDDYWSLDNYLAYPHIDFDTLKLVYINKETDNLTQKMINNLNTCIKKNCTNININTLQNNEKYTDSGNNVWLTFRNRGVNNIFHKKMYSTEITLPQHIITGGDNSFLNKENMFTEDELREQQQPLPQQQFRQPIIIGGDDGSENAVNSVNELEKNKDKYKTQRNGWIIAFVVLFVAAAITIGVLVCMLEGIIKVQYGALTIGTKD